MQTIHATAIASPAPDGRAVLLLGASGVGKSELALRMLDRGWRLIADDRVVTGIDVGGRLTAAAPARLAGLLEVRGVGLVGQPAPEAPVPVALVLDLGKAPERLPEPLGWQAPGLVHRPVPLLGFDGRGEAAPLRLEQALRRHGLTADTEAMTETMASRRPVIAVSGLSGAGRSTALRALEDQGYEVVDNLPLALLAPLIGGSSERPLAFGIDIRTRGFDADALVARMAALRDGGTDIRLLFLDCADETLVRRFSETRRRHPLALDRPAVDGLAPERRLTAPLRHGADLVIDTTGLSVTDLRRRIADYLGSGEAPGLVVTLLSFGFSAGVPRHADLVFDMRFLANPHWDVALRPLSGLDAAVAAHVRADPLYEPAVGRIAELLATLLPGYAREGKAYLTVAIGCTGGRHRSVAVAADLQARLAAEGHGVQLAHRDLAAPLADNNAASGASIDTNP
jgi:RNase adaptor protein for sRNA GlmZ degradation